MIWLVADTHFGHANIIRYCDRPFETKQEHDEALIANWNSVVQKNDTVYHLGDFGFGSPEWLNNKIANRLKGRICLIKGNHDKGVIKEPLVNRFEFVKDVHFLKTQHKGKKLEIFLSHYAHRTWPKNNYGSLMFYGHCVDDETDILTKDGWKNRASLSLEDLVWSYNNELSILELVPILEIIDVNYSGKVYEFDGKSINMRVTPNHTIIRFNSDTKKIAEEQFAEKFFARKYGYILRSGLNHENLEGIDISNDFLKLYILIAADGKIKMETNLARIVVFRDRKKKYIRDILNKLRVEFKEYTQKAGCTSFNFYLPEEIKGYNIKGLDSKLLKCNKEQFEAILEAYGFSDGHFVGNGIIIYSAKEREIDLLQNMAVINGYGATKYSRLHGFGSKLQYQLSVFPSRINCLINLKDRVIVKETANEHFWCIRNQNRNFLMRRKGKVHLTGNSHGNLPPIYNSMDVGVDCCNYYPISLDQALQKIETINASLSQTI